MGCNQTKNYSNNYSNYFNYFSKQSGQGRYLMRQLEETDVTNKNKTYLSLMKQATSLDYLKIKDEEIEQKILEILRTSTLIIIWIDTTAIQDYIVGSATLVCLKSISNNFEKEGHIKDLIISKDHRYKGLDQSLKDALLVIAFQIELVTLLYDDSNKETKKQPFSKNDFLNSDNNLNYTEGPKESRLNNHKNNVFFLTSFLRYDSSINSEKLLLLSADEVGNIHIFDVKTKLLEKSFKLDKKYEKFKNILYIEESKYLSSSLLITSENLLILIDWENGHVIDTFDCKDNINHVIYLPEFNEMSGALTVTNKLIKVMKLDSNKECNIQEIKADKMVSSLVAVKEKIQNFYTFFAGIENGNIIHFDILKNDSNDQILKIFKHCEDDHNIIGLVYIEDENMLISGCEDGLIKSWNVQNYEPLKIIKNDNFPFVKIKTAKKNNENYIIHDQDKNTICVWNLKTGQNVLQITNFGELVRSFDICERESKIAITWNNFIRLIDF